MCRHLSQFAGRQPFQAHVGLAFYPLTLICLPFAPFSEPLYSLRALPPWWALPRLLLDSVVLSALRHYQWVMGGKSAPVAHQGGRAMSANYRHYLLLPPVSSLCPGLQNFTIMEPDHCITPLQFPPTVSNCTQSNIFMRYIHHLCMRVCKTTFLCGLWFITWIFWIAKGKWKLLLSLLLFHL